MSKRDPLDDFHVRLTILALEFFAQNGDMDGNGVEQEDVDYLIAQIKRGWRVIPVTTCPPPSLRCGKRWGSDIA